LGRETNPTTPATAALFSSSPTGRVVGGHSFGDVASEQLLDTQGSSVGIPTRLIGEPIERWQLLSQASWMALAHAAHLLSRLLSGSSSASPAYSFSNSSSSRRWMGASLPDAISRSRASPRRKQDQLAA